MIMNINRLCCWLVGVYVLQILARTNTHTHIHTRASGLDHIGSFSELIGCFNVVIIIWCSILLHYGKKITWALLLLLLLFSSLHYLNTVIVQVLFPQISEYLHSHEHFVYLGRYRMRCGAVQSAACMPFTLYWVDRINYLAAGLLAIITEKEWTASGHFPYVCMSIHTLPS